MQIGKVVSDASCKNDGKFVLKVEKRTIDFVEYIEANYVLIATGSSQQVIIFFLVVKHIKLNNLNLSEDFFLHNFSNLLVGS